MRSLFASLLSGLFIYLFGAFVYLASIKVLSLSTTTATVISIICVVLVVLLATALKSEENS